MKLISLFKCLIIFVILGSVVNGYAVPKANAEKKDNSEVAIGSVHTEDVDVSAATVEARKTVDRFIDILTGKTKVRGAHTFGVKVLLTDKDIVEHMWLSHIKYADGKFTGVIGNTPQRVKNVKLGQMHIVDKHEIIDWAYFEGRIMQGNFTLKAIFPYMNPVEVSRIKNELGW